MDWDRNRILAFQGGGEEITGGAELLKRNQNGFGFVFGRLR
jgi:hypothetical protein